MTTEYHDFDVKFSVAPYYFSVKGKKYVLVEAPASAVVDFDNARMAATTLREGKPSKVLGGATPAPVLVASCVYPITEEGNQGPKCVDVVVVKAWPNRVFSFLFDKVKKDNCIDTRSPDSLRKQIDSLEEQLREAEEKEADLGNSPTDTMDGS